MFQNSPGGMSFERAPFKVTQEYIDVMDGVDSEMFEYFKSLMIKGFIEIRKHLEDILILVEILMQGKLLH
jgi:phosphatidylinositol kinase/protein kinase (PI-3  family)